MKNKITGYKLTQNKKSDLQFLSEWIDLKTNKSDETATMIIEKITEMLKEKKNYKAETHLNECYVPVKRSFFQEFEYPLDKVQRKWLRRSVTLLLSPIIIIAGALFGSFEMGKQWFDECW